MRRRNAGLIPADLPAQFRHCQSFLSVARACVSTQFPSGRPRYVGLDQCERLICAKDEPRSKVTRKQCAE